jgi:hypothetical protein
MMAAPGSPLVINLHAQAANMLFLAVRAALGARRLMFPLPVIAQPYAGAVEGIGNHTTAPPK